MAFIPQSFAPDDEVTDAHMNQFNSNDVFLFDRFLPLMRANCVSETGYGLYIVDFSGANLIDPAQNSGSGAWGATWTKIEVVGNWMKFQVTIPDTVFASTPYVVGHSTGSASQWGIIPCSTWDETATGFTTAVRDTGGPQYAIQTPFAYRAILIGPRKTSPT